MSRPILQVIHGGIGSTPVPEDAVVQPGHSCMVLRERRWRPALCIGVVPRGVSPIQVFSDALGQPRPLMQVVNNFRETTYLCLEDEESRTLDNTRYYRGYRVKKTAYDDLDHKYNSAKYHTGKPCVESGCDLPAGTWWSPLWCQKHNAERIERISKALREEISRHLRYQTPQA